MGETLVTKKRRLEMPHIYVLLMGIIIVCTILTWILPAGEFEREGRTVIAGTYHAVESSPVGLFQMLRCVYTGFIDAGGVLFFVFLAYASIGLIISTGAFNGLVAGLLKVLKGRLRALIIPFFIALIGFASSTIGVFEETFPFIPIFVGIAVAMGYDAIVGLAIVGLGAGLGYSGAFMNPFTVGMAQDIAGLQVMSGWGFRIFCHLSMIAVASVYTVRYALKIQADPTKSLVYGAGGGIQADENAESHAFGPREKLVLLVLLAGIVVIVVGTKNYGWYFEELAAVFLLMGLVSAAIMGWPPNKIADLIAKSFTDIAMACMMIGLARGILMVLQAGNIIDTVVYGMSVPLSYLPRWLAGEAMLLVQTLLNFLIPSGSGQAVVSMPIMAPLSDLLNIPRQVAVLAFQFGDGLSNILWPTALTPVVCGIAGVKVEKWWKWFVPLFGLLLLTQMTLIAIALAVNFS